jgi:cytochrome c biogenesis protein CcmG/thiol:disulfide interchange protein DsbE
VSTGPIRIARRRPALVGGVALVATLMLLPLAFGVTRDPGQLPSALLGSEAPAFSLPRLDRNGSISLSSLRGRVVLVNYWASWCRECRVEHPVLERAWQRFRDQGVVLLGIPFQDQVSGVRSYVAEMGGRWPQLDDGGEAALAFGVFGVPETYLIGADGRLLYRWVGPVTYDDLAERVQQALSGEDR